MGEVPLLPMEMEDERKNVTQLSKGTLNLPHTLVRVHLGTSTSV